MGEMIKPKRGVVLGFAPGTLTLKESGYGEHDGDGEFQFDEDAVDLRPHDDRAGNYFLVALPASEVTAIRNFLNRNAPRSPDATLPDKLRALYREVEALGGATRTEYDAGHERGIERALDVLEAAGFSEGVSTAADVIDGIPDPAATMEEVREVLKLLVSISGSNFIKSKDRADAFSAARMRAAALLDRMGRE